MDYQFSNYIFILIFFVSISFLYFNLSKIIRIIKLGKPEKTKASVWQNIWRMLKIAIGQTKIFRDLQGGWLHASIFWGFLIFLFSAAESVIKGFYPTFNYSFLGWFNVGLSFFTDIISLFILAAVIYALYRRFIIKVPRLQGDISEKIDAILVLSFIGIITLSLLLQNASHIIYYGQEAASFKPISALLSVIIPMNSSLLLYNIFWWIHIGAILVFMNYLPFSKHFHVYTSIFNVYFGNDNIPNKLEPINFEDESIEKYGATEFSDLSWRSLMDGFSCTHCGRCTSVCPANITGKILDPRAIIVQTRQRAMEMGQFMVDYDGNPSAVPDNAQFQAIQEKKFIGDYIDPEALWQCTTCGACMEECPITIEHVPSILEMRRGLVMMESKFPPLLQNTFDNIENSGNPWGFSPAERGMWAENMDVKVAAENPEFEYLFWPGCAGNFDEKGVKVSQVFAHLLKEANIDFAILGSEEQCNGDPARRAGNEYLADAMIKMNVETFKNYKVQKVITTCPHCFNTFKNEYPDFGVKLEVIHHTELLDHLIKEGKLQLDKNAMQQKLTYHDSCYLGRYNQIYQEPRNILKSIANSELIETERNKDKGFCCGAGGAQMFMEETAGKRVNIERSEELSSTNADIIALNCPFCNTMISDGIKAIEGNAKVKDIAQIVYDNLDFGIHKKLEI